MLGAPDDRGISNVGGRLGAGNAPEAIRKMLAQFACGIENNIDKLYLEKGFDIALGHTIEEGHSALRQAVSYAIAEDKFPIVLGGGHDYGFPHLAGAHDAHQGKIAVINVDAHLDLRPRNAHGITSGSPFFLAIESNALRPEKFVEFGIQPHCNSPEYYEYARQKKVRVCMLDEIRKQSGGVVKAFEKHITALAKGGYKVVVSFDVDSVQMAYAPGVSAPQSDGFTPAELFSMAKACGKNTAVTTIGFFELSPDLDTNQMTARLVCTAIHRFLSEFSLRTVSAKKFAVPLKRKQ